MELTQNLNPQNLKPGETCRERGLYYLGYACGVSVWSELPWSIVEQVQAREKGCQMCAASCCSGDEE